MSQRQSDAPVRQLSIHDHSRDSAGLRYVYPVVSRRAGGVSLGINLNVNNACNWACIYCQVPDLARGAPPPVDVGRLERELRGLLQDIVEGDYLVRHAPPEARRLVDVAFSGNGEPTAAKEFPDVVACVSRVMDDVLPGWDIPLRLITNGSLVHRLRVQQGIAAIGRRGGEVWFKFDRATVNGALAVNGVRVMPQQAIERLVCCTELAPTWVQTCFFALDGAAPSTAEQRAYLAALETVRDRIRGVQLYGLARPSMQPGASRLSSVKTTEMEKFADAIAGLGIRVALSL